jgi:hypothetical protein
MADRYFTPVKSEHVTNPYPRPRLSCELLEGIRFGLVIDCCRQIDVPQFIRVLIMVIHTTHLTGQIELEPRT